jgi:hypothetical protein
MIAFVSRRESSTLGLQPRVVYKFGITRYEPKYRARHSSEVFHKIIGQSVKIQVDIDQAFRFAQAAFGLLIGHETSNTLVGPCYLVWRLANSLSRKQKMDLLAFPRGSQDRIHRLDFSTGCTWSK